MTCFEGLFRYAVTTSIWYIMSPSSMPLRKINLNEMLFNTDEEIASGSKCNPEISLWPPATIRAFVVPSPLRRNITNDGIRGCPVSSTSIHTLLECKEAHSLTMATLHSAASGPMSAFGNELGAVLMARCTGVETALSKTSSSLKLSKRSHGGCFASGVAGIVKESGGTS